jgi:Abortive infection C-terminus
VTKPIISKKTTYEFQEYLSGSKLREIEILFDSADILCDDAYEPKVSGERRSLVSKYYHTLDLTIPDHARKLIHVFEEILSQLESKIKEPPSFSTPDLAETDRKSFDRLCLRLKHDGLMYKEGKIVALGHNPSLTHLEFIAVTADFSYLVRQMERIESSIDSDPWLAIGTAKELVETTCKSILAERNKEINPGWTFMELCKETRKELKLTPDDIPQANKAATTIKVLLNNLATIVQGLSELRNPYGTGHGHEARTRGLKPRHARLAAGAASTLAVFFLETHREATPKAD